MKPYKPDIPRISSYLGVKMYKRHFRYLCDIMADNGWSFTISEEGVTYDSYDEYIIHVPDRFKPKILTSTKARKIDLDRFSYNENDTFKVGMDKESVSTGMSGSIEHVLLLEASVRTLITQCQPRYAKILRSNSARGFALCFLWLFISMFMPLLHLSFLSRARTDFWFSYTTALLPVFIAGCAWDYIRSRLAGCMILPKVDIDSEDGSYLKRHPHQWNIFKTVLTLLLGGILSAFFAKLIK